MSRRRPGFTVTDAAGVRPRLITPAFLLIAGATLAYFIAENVVLPVLPVYVRGPLGGGDVAAGVSVGAFSVTALVIRPLAGRWSDRRGRRPPMVIGAAIFSVSAAGYLVSDSVLMLVAMRLLTGVGEAFFFTGAASAIADLAPEDRRGEAISFFSLALWTGVALGPTIGELAVHGGRFSLVWLISTGFGLLAGVLALWVRARPPEEPAAASRLIQRGALRPGAAVMMSVWGAAGFFTFVPLYARGMGLSGSRLVFLLFSGIVVAIRLFGARLPDRLGLARTARSSLVVSAFGLALLGLWRNPAGLFVGSGVYAVGQALAFPALMALGIQSAPSSERASAIATFTAAVDIAFGLGPATLGFVADATSYNGSFLVGSAVALVGLLILARSRISRGAGDPSG
jgi:MFS family permease